MFRLIPRVLCVFVVSRARQIDHEPCSLKEHALASFLLASYSPHELRPAKHARDYNDYFDLSNLHDMRERREKSYEMDKVRNLDPVEREQRHLRFMEEQEALRERQDSVDKPVYGSSWDPTQLLYAHKPFSAANMVCKGKPAFARALTAEDEEQCEKRYGVLLASRTVLNQEGYLAHLTLSPHRDALNFTVQTGHIISTEVGVANWSYHLHTSKDVSVKTLLCDGEQIFLARGQFKRVDVKGLPYANPIAMHPLRGVEPDASFERDFGLGDTEKENLMAKLEKFWAIKITPEEVNAIDSLRDCRIILEPKFREVFMMYQDEVVPLGGRTINERNLREVGLHKEGRERMSDVVEQRWARTHRRP